MHRAADMSEVEQLRKEVNELRERVAVLEKRPVVVPVRPLEQQQEYDRRVAERRKAGDI